MAKHWPHLLVSSGVTRDQIRDRGKANGLTKFLACWQATWFCVQCIYRLSSGLSISLLELNVFGHAICAVLIYALWWEKPQDVTQPHVFAMLDSHEAAAALCTFSRMGRIFRERQELGSLAYHPLRRSEADESTIDLRGPGVILLKPHSRKCDPTSSETSSLSFKVGDTCWRVELRPAWNDPDLTRDIVLIDQWAFARLKYGGEMSGTGVYLPLSLRCRDWCIDIDYNADLDIEPLNTLYYSAAISFASAIYGGLHLTAFWAPFPSAVERLLWRTSSLTVVVFGAVFCILVCVNAYVEKQYRDTSVFGYCLLAFLVPALLWYLLCRAFLVIECFISLAYLSPSQLAIPTWSLYIPHLT